MASYSQPGNSDKCELASGFCKVEVTWRKVSAGQNARKFSSDDLSDYVQSEIEAECVWFPSVLRGGPVNRSVGVT